MTLFEIGNPIPFARGLILKVLLLSAVTACNSVAPALGPQVLLADSSWRLVSIDDRPIERRSSPVIDFGTDSIAGHTGCNRYSAPISLSDNSISIGPIHVSHAACADQVERLEARFIEQLEAAYKLDVSLEFLAVFSNDVRYPLRFVRTR